MQILRWFDTSLDEDYPAVWGATAELREDYLRTLEEKRRPSKTAVKAANIIEGLRRSEGQASRTVAAPLSKKRVASTEEPRSSERRTKRRQTLMAAKLKLEKQLERVNRQLGDIEEE